MQVAAHLEHTLFVYGTLKRFFTNHKRYLGVAEGHGGARYIGRAETCEKYPLVVRPLHMPPATAGPVLMDKAGVGHKISGEVFCIDGRTLEAMDILEGVKSGAYYKTSIDVMMSGDKQNEYKKSCIAYFYPANDELCALPYFSSYAANQHALYTPCAAVRQDILELCSSSQASSHPQPSHSLSTSTACSMKTHCLRLLPGDDIVQSLRIFAQSNGIDAAIILTCVGSTSLTTLRPAGVSIPRIFENKYEIVSMTGTFSRTGHHLHMSISDSDCNVSGGHMLDGCIVRTTAEIALGLIEGVAFTRPDDPRTGYDELSINHEQDGDSEIPPTKRPRER